MTSQKRPEDRREDDLEQLRKLLLGEDRDRFDRLDQRISGFENRAGDVAEVLPTAFQRVADDPSLEAEIGKPILQTIRSSIKRDANDFAELLFPVIGPAIRRAVADALKSLVQRINAAMEHSFSIKGLRWRAEAARTGVSFAQVVLGHTMRYAVQEAFLIARDTGLVLAHAHRDENLVLDEDAVAAMLTAIQSFIQDSLGMSADDPLRSAELGDRTLWVINGPDAILACVISGTPPRIVRDELMVLLEAIHARYGERFTEPNDVLLKDMGLRLLVQKSLLEEMDDPSENKPRSKAPVYWMIAIALLLAFVGWKSWQGYQERKFESQVVGLIGAQPGYVVSSSHREKGILVVNGLRDPGTPMPGGVLSEQGLGEEDIQFRFKPFLSLDESLVLRRLRDSLQLTDASSLNLNGKTLRVEGVISSDQFDAFGRLAGVHPLINSVELSGTRLNADEAVRLARFELEAPDSVTLTANDGRIAVSGLSEIQWYLGKSSQAWVIGGWEISFEPLLADLQEQLRADAAELGKTEIDFSRRDQLTPESATEIDPFTDHVKSLLQSASALGVNLTINLIGEADGTGTELQNSRVARSRVSVVWNRLTGAGIDPDHLQAAYLSWKSGDGNVAQRRVTVRINENQQ